MYIDGCSGPMQALMLKQRLHNVPESSLMHPMFFPLLKFFLEIAQRRIRRSDKLIQLTL